MTAPTADPMVRTSLSNRAFGIQVGVAFVAIGVLLALANVSSRLYWTFGVLGVFLLLAGLLVPKYLESPKKIWFRVGFFLARLFNPLILALLYISIFIPLGLFFRLSGRDELQLRRPQENSMWVRVGNRAHDSEFFRAQY